jgi:hypothetical protein
MQVTYDLEDKVFNPIDTGEKTHLVYAVVIDQGQLYTDLTFRFTVRSSKGNWYVMMVYSFDSNYINPVAMKSKSASEWLKAFEGIFQELTSCGFKPKSTSGVKKLLHGKWHDVPIFSSSLPQTQCNRARH